MRPHKLQIESPRQLKMHSYEFFYHSYPVFKIFTYFVRKYTKNMHKYSVVILFLFLIGSSKNYIFSQNEDNKIVISNKDEVYRYELGKKGEVRVELEYTTNYKCQKPSSVSFVEYYNDYSEISDVKIKGIKDITPSYGMYKQENVFFSDAKACYFKMPFIKTGSEASVTLKKTYNDIRYFNFLPLAEPNFILSKTVKIVIPDWMQVNLFLRNPPENIKKDSVRDEAQKTTTYIFQLANQPEFVPEENTPDYRHSQPYLTIVPRESFAKGQATTYFKTVDNLYKWYKKPLETLNNDAQSVKDKSIELTQNIDKEKDKVRELIKWVQQNIRYLAFENGIAAFRPDEAQGVMFKKYGDCKGMANLLKALLAASGFDVRLTWVNASLEEQKKINVHAPVPFANHMICSLFWNDSIYFIDPTVKSLSFGEIPDQLQGKEVMIENGENFQISKIPESHSKDNIDSLFIKYTVAGNKLAGKGSRIFRGESKHSILFWLNSLSQGDKKMMFERLLNNRETQDSVFNIESRGLEAFLPEVCINYESKTKSNINIFSNQAYINLDNCKDYQNDKIDIANRKTALMLPCRDCIVRVSEIQIPAGYKLQQLPQNIKIEREKYVFAISYRQHGDKIIYKKDILILNPVLEKEDFKQWNSDIDTLRKAYNELTVLAIK